DQVPRERGLGDLDALRGQQLRELRLGGDLLVREQLDDPLLARGLGLGEGAARIAHRRSPAGRAWAAVDSSGWSSSQVSRAFWACRRFSASSQTTEAGPSMTSAATSLPRQAGRQCRNRPPQRSMSSWVTWYGAKVSSPRPSSPSCPTDTQVSVSTAVVPATASRGSAVTLTAPPVEAAISSARAITCAAGRCPSGAAIRTS